MEPLFVVAVLGEVSDILPGMVKVFVGCAQGNRRALVRAQPDAPTGWRFCASISSRLRH